MNLNDAHSLGCFGVRTLEALSIPYMITGAVASSFYGEPRATFDVDVVIEPESAQFQRFLHRLVERAHCSLEAANAALRNRTAFSAICVENAEKIDFILRREHPFNVVEFSRRRRLDYMGFEFDAVSLEDCILSKFVWFRKGRAEYLLRDAYGMLRIQADNLDWEYLRHWAAELGKVDTLDSLLKEIENDKARE